MADWNKFIERAPGWKPYSPYAKDDRMGNGKEKKE